MKFNPLFAALVAVALLVCLVMSVTPGAAGKQKGAILVPLSPLKEAANDLKNAKAITFEGVLPEEDLFSTDKEVKLRQISDDRAKRFLYLDARYRFETAWLNECVMIRDSIKKATIRRDSEDALTSMLAVLDRSLQDVREVTATLGLDASKASPPGLEIARTGRLAEQRKVVEDLQTKIYEEQIMFLKFANANKEFRSLSTPLFEALDKVISTTENNLTEYQKTRKLYEDYYRDLEAAVNGSPSKPDTRSQNHKR